MKIFITRLITLFLILKLTYSQSWNLGTGLIYDTTTSILLGEKSQSVHDSKDDVGFQITARVKVLPIWKDPTDSETVLISIKTESLQLWIKSRKAPKPEGFVEHTSRLDSIPKEPIFLLWKNGQIKSIFSSSDESVSSLNLKRGIASIFQYRTTPAVLQEKDASGMCNVTYKTLRPRSFEKIKEFCKTIKNEHSNPILGVKLKNFNVVTYELTESLIPKEVIEEEKHEMSLVVRPEAKSAVTTHRVFKLLPGTFKESPIVASTYTEVLNKYKSRYADVSIETQHEYAPCPESGCLSLEAAIETNFKALESANLGTIKSASAFLKIIPLIRQASADNLAKILKSPKYRDILPQLYDLYGSASTIATHQAAMKVLRQDDTGENTERYLWALSTSSYPDPDIIKEILKRSEETIQNDKLSETYALTAAAMAKRYGTPSVIEKVKDSLEVGLYTCTGEQCKAKFLRSLGNLGSKTVVPILLRHANSTKWLSITAWKAICSLHSTSITSDVKEIAMKTFLQLNGQKIDSTVRTLALNVILQHNPTVEELEELLLYLTRRDPVYEVKKYLLQRIQQLAATDNELMKKLKIAMKKDYYKIVNYDTFAQRGLSTAFTRDFLRSTGANGSLITIQEISSGLLKRGLVDVVLQSGTNKYTFFTLGLFAGGLNSFISSNDQEDNEIPVDNEPATAGMEISLLDVDIRPFVFFSGQGELMGHVWSGTASERTPAFQSIVNLHRHREVFALGSGFIVEIEVEGAISVDLAGQVQLSLWSRNAQSLVELESGIAVQGSSKIMTDFVQSRAEFTLTLEPKLELATDVDFSGPVTLCMRLAQPQARMKHLVYKVERIPGSRHRLRKMRRIQLHSPGRSYLLNSKNNEMCSKIFS